MPKGYDLRVRRYLVACLVLAACSSNGPTEPPITSAKILAFTASPTRIRAGESTTLTWETEGGTGVAIEPSVGLQPSVGSLKVRPIGRTVYTLKLRVDDEVLTSQATVEVDGGAATIERFIAEPRTIQPGEASVLSWRVVNASRVNITPDVGEAQETLEVGYTGPEMQIAFNPEFLQAPLRALDTDNVYLDLIDEMSPGVLRIEGTFLYVLMPMRVTN